MRVSVHVLWCALRRMGIFLERGDQPVSTFFQTLIVGLRLGSIYALVALGYTMVYGIIRLINSPTVTLSWWAAIP